MRLPPLLLPVLLLGAARALPGAASVPAEAVVRLAEVVVTPSRFGIADQAAGSAATLTGRQLETLPQVGQDLYRSIARLPGLAADDISAQFWVRGAPQAEVRGRLDGLELIEPFHLKDVGGALSIVDPAVIGWLELSTGGFGAEHGDRLAGVLTLETRSEARTRSAVDLSLTGLGLRREGALPGGARYLVTARRGYPDVALKASGRDDDVSPRYFDALAKLEFAPAPGHALSFHALHAGDDLRYARTNSPSLRSSYDTSSAWARWRVRERAGWNGETVAAWSALTWNRTGSGRLDGFPFGLRDRRGLDVAHLRSEWSRPVGDAWLWRAGGEVRRGAARYDYALSQQRGGVANGVQVTRASTVAAQLEPRDTGGAGFAAARGRLPGGWLVETGLRADRAPRTSAAEWGPRVNVAWVTGDVTWRAAWGRHAQAQGLHELAVADGERQFAPPERAEHRVLGLETRLGAAAALRVEAYDRPSSRLRPRWVNLDNAYDLFPEAQADRTRLDPERGRARGVEVLLAGRGRGPWQWNASYAWARTEERIAGRWVPRARDQRHAAYGDVTYAPGDRWTFSAAWHFHSGWPTTEVTYGLAPLNNGRRLLVSANGPAFGLRLPAYHRLDLRATRRIPLRTGELRVQLDLFNAYDRLNFLGYDRKVSVAGNEVTVRREAREQLPFLPSAGLIWEF
ncbi:MAG: TonB-dependent receptor plug domain-containing protein [Opitutaceae bacterium]